MLTNNDPVPIETIAIQGWLRPAITPVLANRDYDRFADELEEVEALIRNSALEEMAVEFALEGLDASATDRQRRGKAQFSLFALRSVILRHLLGAPGFVAYSSTLASSELLSDFCGCRSVAGIKAPAGAAEGGLRPPSPESVVEKRRRHSPNGTVAPPGPRFQPKTDAIRGLEAASDPSC